MPNGIITEYEVSYRPTDSSQPPITTSTGLETSFTTDSDLELGTEFIFSVTASNGAGPGEPATVTVSTLTRPREEKHWFAGFSVCVLLFLHSSSRRSGGVI